MTSCPHCVEGITTTNTISAQTGAQPAPSPTEGEKEDE